MELTDANATQLIGWTSSLLLCLTISRQVYCQWRRGTSEGVSAWLFVGQLVASTGFLVFSWRIGSMVFVVTNAALVVAALAGLGLLAHHRRTRREPTRSRTRPARRAIGRHVATSDRA